MGKYYKVPLFQYRNNDVQKVDDIIVKRDILGTAREIVSEITMDIYTQKEGPTRNDHIIVDYDIEQRGVYLFVRKKDMNPTSFATATEVKEYVDSFGNKPFKDVAFQIFEHERKVKEKK